MRAFRKGYLRVALQSIRMARTRSFMTMLGIIIGIVSVVVIVAVSEGIKQQVGNQVSRYGKDVILVRPTAAGEVAGVGLSAAGSPFAAADMTMIKQVQGVLTAVPIATIQGSVKGDKTVDSPLVIATAPELETVLNQKIDYGGFFTAADAGRAAVLGSDMVAKMYTDDAPLGQNFTFRGHDFMVSGVYKPFLATAFSLEANYNKAVFIPYDVAQSMLGTPPAIQEVFVKVAPGKDVQKVATQVHEKLVQAHGGTDDVVTIISGSKSLAKNPTLSLLTRMIVITALVALIVGGVGIMNMMLVSVTERIHEIGLRKAVGATNKQILRQFMTEAAVLCGMGAVLGFVIALASIGLMAVFTTLEPVIIWPVATGMPFVAFATGVLFGTIPALKAARMDPIEALRHE